MRGKVIVLMLQSADEALRNTDASDGRTRTDGQTKTKRNFVPDSDRPHSDLPHQLRRKKQRNFMVRSPDAKDQTLFWHFRNSSSD